MRREPFANTAGNAHGFHRLGQFTGLHAAQTGQRVHHGLAAAHQLRGASVGTEFAVARKPGHNDGSGKTQHDIEHDGADVVTDAGTGIAAAAASQEAVNGIANHAREENHEGVHDALDQRHGDHVAIGHMGNLVAQHGLDLFLGHALQQAGGYCHQRGVLERPRGKGIGRALENADLGHADLRLVGELAHGLDNPRLVAILAAVNQAHAGAPLGDRFADQQRNDRAAKADDQRKAEQHAEVQAVGREKAIHAKQAGNNAQHRHNSDIGQYKQENAFHGFSVEVGGN